MKGSWQGVRVQFFPNETSAVSAVIHVNVCVYLFYYLLAYLTAGVEVQKPPGFVHKIREVVQYSETGV